MCRTIDANAIANLVVDAGTPAEDQERQARRVAERFERCTRGLTEYERDQVACMVNFRLSAPVL